jgi:hypothetical protein
MPQAALHSARGEVPHLAILVHSQLVTRKLREESLRLYIQADPQHLKEIRYHLIRGDPD